MQTIKVGGWEVDLFIGDDNVLCFTVYEHGKDGEDEDALSIDGNVQMVAGKHTAMKCTAQSESRHYRR